MSDGGEPREPPLRAQAVRAAGWATVQRWVDTLGSVAIYILLAHLVAPRAFGLVALANVLVMLLAMVQQQGFATALIQRKQVDELLISSAFWMSIGFSLFAGLVLFALSWPLAALWGQHELVSLIQVLALVMPLSGLQSVPTALLSRDLNFRVLAMRDIAAMIAGGGVGIGLAIGGAGVWALVAQDVVYVAAGSALLWTTTAWRPSRKFSRRHIAELLPFSARNVGIQSMTFASKRTDDLLIGAVLGPVPLGYYSIGYNFLLNMNGLLVGTVNSVALPLFSRVQHDLPAVRRMFRFAMRGLLLIAAPIYVGVLIAAPDIVPTIFGRKWLPSVHVFEALALVGLLQCFELLLRWLLMALGETKVAFRLNVLSTIGNVVAFAIAVHWGITWVAIGLAIRGYALLPLLVHAVRRVTGSGWRDLLSAAAPAAIGAVPMAGALLLARSLYPSSFTEWTRLGIDIGVAGSVYALALLITARSVLRETVDVLRPKKSPPRVRTNR